MVMGFVAVFATIIFRISSDNLNSEVTIQLPPQILIDKNTSIKSFQIQGNLLYILTESGNESNIIVIDQTRGEIISKLKFLQNNSEK